MNPPSSTRWAAALLFVFVTGLGVPWPGPATGNAPEPSEFSPQFKPTLAVSRASGTIQVDGDLADPGWRGAARAVGFAEVSPGDQVRPPVESEAWVTYDDRNLYVALIARDNPREVRASICQRDDIFRDDYFGLMLDTYGDQSWGYELFVNPLGIQGDLRMETSGNEDITFDLVWESQGRVTDSGYQVEIAIPFASLRFPDRPVQEWRVNFWRDHQRDLRRRYAWAATDRDNPCFMCQWGTLVGISGIRPGRDLEVIASGLATRAGELRDTDDPRSPFRQGDLRGEAGANLRYALSSSASAEIAFNPDFSQVESDAGQIDVNNTFALYYDELRPFFQEGSDLYDTYIDAIYTRSLNDPDLAGKLSGRIGKTSALYLFAHDVRTPAIIPLEQRSEVLQLEKSFSHILRVKRPLRESSFVGLLATHRQLDGGGSGTVLAADGHLRFWRNYALQFQLAGSRTQEPDNPALTADLDPITFDRGAHTVAYDGERYGGHGLYSCVQRDGRVWGLELEYTEYSPTFRTDNGFTTQNDFRRTAGWTGLYFQPNRKWLVSWQPSVGIGRVWNTEGRFKDEWLRPGLWFNTRGQTEIGAQYLLSKERFGSGTFPGIRIWSGWLDTAFSEMLAGGCSFSRGHGIYRDFDAPELARQWNWSAYARWKPSSHLQLRPSLSYGRMDSDQSGEVLFSGFILRNRLYFNFDREWSLRFIAEYNTFHDRLDLEPLLTYRVSPFTVFYLGSANRLHYYDREDVEGLADSEWKSSSRQYFAKLQYLFRL